MKQEKESEPPLITIFCFVAIITLMILSIVIARNPRDESIQFEYESIQPSVLYAWESPVLHYQVLGSMTGSTIDRLIACESGGDPSAINYHDPITRSVGILQFKDETYKHFCVEQYGLPNDIWNPTNQIACAKIMIKEGYGNHWSCWE